MFHGFEYNKHASEKKPEVFARAVQRFAGRLGKTLPKVRTQRFDIKNKEEVTKRI